MLIFIWSRKLFCSPYFNHILDIFYLIQNFWFKHKPKTFFGLFLFSPDKRLHLKLFCQMILFIYFLLFLIHLIIYNSNVNYILCAKTKKKFTGLMLLTTNLQIVIKAKKKPIKAKNTCLCKKSTRKIFFGQVK